MMKIYKNNNGKLMNESSYMLASGRKEFDSTRKGLQNTRKLNKIRQKIADKYYDNDFILSKVAERILIEVS